MKIYFYTFPSTLNQERPMLKIGQTTQDDVNVRIAQQMGTATPEKPILKGQFEVTFTDKEFHHFLVERGIERPDGAGTEWFYITTEEAEPLLYEFAALSEGRATPIRKPLELRPYQQQFVDQFTTTDGDFLLFAKCRSGKSVMGLMAAQQSDFRSVLVVSLRTSAGNSWLKDPATFTAFHEWDAIDLHDSDAIAQIKKSQAAGRRTLMVGTVQGTDSKFALQARLKRVFPNGIDALYFDECHIGGLADMVKKLRQSIDFGRCLEISGTAFKASWFYDRKNTFVWDYVKEQEAGLGLPKMELTLVNYDASGLQEVYGDDPDRLNNIWTVEDGKWQDEASVRNFVARFFTHGRVHKKRQLFRGSDHIVMSLPSVAACDLAVELFTDMGMPWSPISITGESGNDQEKILQHVSSHPKTICFTRWANVVGVTIPAWDTVVHGSKTNSAEFYVQFSFRGGSTKRDSWKVIDFSPEQALNSVIEMVQATSDAEESPDPGNSLKRFLEFADVHEFDEGFEDVDYSRLLELACSDATDAVTSLNRRCEKLGSYGDYSLDLAKAFSGSEKCSSEKVVDMVLKSNNTQDRGNTQLTGDRKEPRKNDLKALMKQIKGALGTIPAVVATHVDEPITTVHQLLSSPHLELITGVDRKGFEMAISSGWISSRELSSAVAQSSLVMETLRNS